jgi:hypothetical protein
VIEYTLYVLCAENEEICSEADLQHFLVSLGFSIAVLAVVAFLTL